MFTPDCESSFGSPPTQLPAGGLPSAAPTGSPHRLRTPAAWRDAHQQVLSDRGLFREENQMIPQREVSYAVGTRQVSLSSPGLSCSSQSRLEAHATGIDMEQRLRLRRNLDVRRFEASSSGPFPTAGGCSLFDKLSQSHDCAPPSSISEGRTPIKGGSVEVDAARSQEAAGEDNSRASLSSLAAERDRLQRQVHEMRNAVADTRRELISQHDQQRLQTFELRHTLASLQTNAETLQKEQSEQQKKTSHFTERMANKTVEVDAVLRQRADGLAVRGHNLEEESTRRDAGAELQHGTLQSQAVDGAHVGQLQRDLGGARQAMQNHSGGRGDLTRRGRPCSGIRPEASDQCGQLARTTDSVPRARSCDTFRDSSTVHSDQDMISREGNVVVKRMVDTTKSLMHSLEEALVARVGLMASIFHTWRCEVTMLRAGRQYQEEFTQNQREWEALLTHDREAFEAELQSSGRRHLYQKQRARLQAGLLLDVWSHADAVGLTRSCLRAWRRHNHVEQRFQRAKARNMMVAHELVEGKRRRVAHACLWAWKHWKAQERQKQERDTTLATAHAHFQQELEKECTAAERKMKEGMLQLEACRRSSKRNLRVALAKWEHGYRKGILHVTWQAWEMLRRGTKAAFCRSQVQRQVFRRVLDGNQRWARHSCFTAWRGQSLHAKSLEELRLSFDELLSGEQAKSRIEMQTEQERHRMKFEVAKEKVYMVLRMRALGNIKGLKLEVFHLFARYCLLKAEKEKKYASVELALGQWAEGQQSGLRHVSFLRWKMLYGQSSARRRHDEELKREAEKLRTFLAEAQTRHETVLEQSRSEFNSKLARAQQAVAHTLNCWLMGDVKSLFRDVFDSWRNIVSSIQKSVMQRKAVHASLLRQLEGGKRGGIHIAFLSWSSLVASYRLEATKQENIRIEREHWERIQKDMEKTHQRTLRGVQAIADTQKMKAVVASELALKKWYAGETKGSVITVFINWRRCVSALRSVRAKSLAVQSTLLRFLVGNVDSSLRTVLICWRNHILVENCQQKRMEVIDRLERQLEQMLRGQEARLTKYATLLGNSLAPVLVHMIFSAWREAASGIKHLEYEREREMKIEELKRRHDLQKSRKLKLEAGALVALGLKDEAVFTLQIFMGWKAHYEAVKLRWLYRVNHNQVLERFAAVTLFKRIKVETTSLLTVCVAEWHREGQKWKRERLDEERQRQFEDSRIYISQLEQRTINFEDQLMMSYKQIDHVTETLQKELQTKEELAMELRDAYDKCRRNAFASTNLTPSTALTALDDSTRSSRQGGLAQSRSQSTGSLHNARPSRANQKYVREDTLVQSAGSFSHSRLNSPSPCDWDHALHRMREEGVMSLSRSGR